MKSHQTSAARTSKIPPPPRIEDGYEALIAYHGKYSMEELEAAGYLDDAPAEHVREVAESAIYQLLCQRGLHLKLSRKANEQLSHLAASRGISAEDLAIKWLTQRLGEDSKKKGKPKR